MKAQEIYNRAKYFGVTFECDCTMISAQRWDKLMSGATRADRRQVIKAAHEAGLIDRETYRTEIKKPYYNPYNHFKTGTHLVYVHSCIEHFLKIN